MRNVNIIFAYYKSTAVFKYLQFSLNAVIVVDLRTDWQLFLYANANENQAYSTAKKK